MSNKHLQEIDQAIAEISSSAHMDIDEAKDFIYLYLETQIKSNAYQQLYDDNVEGVFTQTAHKLNIPLGELKTTIYDIVSKQYPHSA